jgi:signal transduction histidine kinase
VGLAERANKNKSEYSVATAPPTSWERRLAFAVVVVCLVAYGAVAPFARIPLHQFDSFIPTVTAIVFVTDFVTAVLLFGQSSATGSRALPVLASGYLFSSLIVIPYTLTFPGAFAPTGLLGAGTQSAAWLNVFSRCGLALATVGYALLISGKHTTGLIKPSPPAAICRSVAIVIIVVCALTSAVTAGHDLMPRLLGEGAILPLGYYANGMITLMNVLAVLLLWCRGKSVLDLWLMVAGCALIMETGQTALLTPFRFTVGFYASRLISLVVSKVVLIVLLSETVILQARLTLANRNLQRERENKLTAAGAVVAALAHEVNQPLAAVTINAAVVKRFLDRAPPDIAEAKNFLDRIGDAGSRAIEVFENFLSLFRGSMKEHQLVNINALMLEAMLLLRTQLDDHNIVVRTMLQSDLPDIWGNVGQLREVILNLVQNSIEAMATITGKRIISVATSSHPSDSISISLQDTGPGIDPTKLTKIFDPFVTTKAKGTGLGLAICKMIIEEHGGKLSAAFDMHDGARFEVTLPTNIPTALSRAPDDELKEL